MSTEVAQHNQPSKKVKSAISRAEGIQQREQLRQMILNKFIQDLAKNNKKKQEVIQQEVDNFFKSEKVTEQTLKELKNKVYQAVQGKALSQTGSQKQEIDQQSTGNNQQKQESTLPKLPQYQDDAKSVHSQKSYASKKSLTQSQKQYVLNNQNRGDEALSYTSSKAPPSVYYVEGDEEDEWATLVKFDTELFKKEQELEKMRQHEFKNKMKNELDRQLVDKQRRVQGEKQELDAYVSLQNQQLQSFDNREQNKGEEKRVKLQNEKRQRDKQVHDENVRRKLEKKREKELDEMLVLRIKEEKQLEEDEQLKKKLKEKNRLLEMMKENDEYKQISDAEARREKNNDIRLQQEYIRLQEEMEQQRDAEKRQREEKIKKIMSAFADSVVKDQRAVIQQEDQKMLKHILDQNDREKQEDLSKKQTIKEQRGDMRDYLKKQMEDRQIKKQQEEELNKMQADIWQKDKQNYVQHESEKHSYINMVNKKHQQILLEQINERNSKSKKLKMNTEELLQNKSKLKEIVEKNPEAAEKLKKINL